MRAERPGPSHSRSSTGFTFRPTARRRSLGDDLDGDGVIDNELGMVMGTLTTFGDRTTGTASMIASGALASTVLIQAEDLTTDDAVAVTYLGADGAPAKAVGGTFAAGRFVSNRTRDSHESAEAEVHLAVLDAADPTILHVRAVEITLTPDGRGGYDGLFRGVADPAEATDAAATGVQQMLTASPHDHAGFASAMDRDADGTVTIPEIESAPIFVSLLAPDLKMFVGTELSPQPKSSVPDSLSLGFGFHLSPCPAGSCVTTAPADRCNDRVLDGDETDIDCGGCAARAALARPVMRPATATAGRATVAGVAHRPAATGISTASSRISIAARCVPRSARPASAATSAATARAMAAAATVAATSALRTWTWRFAAFYDRAMRQILLGTFALLAASTPALADEGKQMRDTVAAEFAITKAKIDAGKAYESLRAADKLAEQAQNDWSAATSDAKKAFTDEAAATKNAKLADARKAAAAATQTIIDADTARAAADKKYDQAGDASATAAQKLAALDEAAAKARATAKHVGDPKALAGLAAAGKEVAEAEAKISKADAALEAIAEVTEKAELLLGKGMTELENPKATAAELATAAKQVETAEGDLVKAVDDEHAQLVVRAKAERDGAAASKRVAVAMRAVATAEQDRDAATAGKAAADAADKAALADAALADAADAVTTAAAAEATAYRKASAPYIALAKVASKDHVATANAAMVDAFAKKDRSASELRKALGDRAKASEALSAALGAKAKALEKRKAASADL